MTPQWRDRARELLRAELAVAGAEILIAEGYDAVTAEDLARRLGISRATFFRYFAGKDEVIPAALHPGEAQYFEDLEALELRPDETAWDLVRRALAPIVAATVPETLATRRRMRFALQTPALRSRLDEERRARERRLADILETRLEDALTARVVAAAALAALDVAWEEWAGPEADDLGLETTLDRVIAALNSPRARMLLHHPSH